MTDHIPLELFSYHRNDMNEKVLCSELSTLQGNGHEVLSVITVKFHHTSKIATFSHETTDRDREGELQALHYRSIAGTGIGRIKLVIFND